MLRFKRINFFGILYSTVVAILIFTDSVRSWWLILGGVLWIGLLAWGAFDMRLNVFTKAVSHQKQEKRKRIALTFDDGPTLFTPKVLELLTQYKAKATFFCIGNVTASSQTDCEICRISYFIIEPCAVPKNNTL